MLLSFYTSFDITSLSYKLKQLYLWWFLFYWIHHYYIYLVYFFFTSLLSMKKISMKNKPKTKSLHLFIWRGRRKKLVWEGCDWSPFDTNGQFTRYNSWPTHARTDTILCFRGDQFSRLYRRLEERISDERYESKYVFQFSFILRTYISRKIAKMI